ncbi:MAG: hypothetical protein IJS78_07210 [Clostridia bacterium]|nr:hypothetical protein [Clostridia bacterium]
MIINVLGNSVKFTYPPANAFEEDVKQCLLSGMNAHLAKPVDIELLKETPAKLLPPRG